MNKNNLKNAQVKNDVEPEYNKSKFLEAVNRDIAALNDRLSTVSSKLIEEISHAKSNRMFLEQFLSGPDSGEKDVYYLEQVSEKVFEFEVSYSKSNALIIRYKSEAELCCEEVNRLKRIKESLNL